MESKETIIQVCYKLVKEWLPKLSKLPKNYKFNLGQRIQDMLTDLLEMYIKAYYSNKDKNSMLQEANLKLETLRWYIRLLHDLKLISFKEYETLSIQINDLGKMTGAWLKSLKN